MHFALFVDAADPVEQAFDAAAGRIKEGFFALEDAGHENAEGLCDGEQTSRKSTIWNQPLGVMSEFLRPQAGRNQIHAHQYGFLAEQCFLASRWILSSLALLQLVASPHVRDGHYKKSDGACHKDEILHCRVCSFERWLSQKFLHTSVSMMIEPKASGLWSDLANG